MKIVGRPDGKRRRLLWIVGTLSIALGLAHVCGPQSLSFDLGFRWLPTNLDADELGWVWIVCGTTTASAALWGGHTAEKIGFGAAMLPPTAWSAIFLISTMMGNPFGIRAGIAYALIAAMVATTAGWPDTHTPVDQEASE